MVFEDEERPLEEVGTRYRAVRDGNFEKGDILTLDENDGSKMPYFVDGGNYRNCEEWCFLEPLGAYNHDEYIAANRKTYVRAWKPKEGELIEVGVYNKHREFIAITSQGKYLCWTENKNDAYVWNIAKEIK